MNEIQETKAMLKLLLGVAAITNANMKEYAKLNTMIED